MTRAFTAFEARQATNIHSSSHPFVLLHHLVLLDTLPSNTSMAGVAFGSAALGGAFSLAAAGYQTSAGFAARHEIAHAQQIEITRRYISEFEDAYIRGEVSEYDWRQYTDLRER